MSIRLALLMPALVMTSGCYLVHERAVPPTPIDAGFDARDAARPPPVDAAPADTNADHEAPDSGDGCEPRSVMAVIGPSLRMDVTEVTQEDYARFLRCAPSAPGPAACPPSDHAPCEEGFQPATSPWVPVTCMSWCDAAAYCAWAGKRLCTYDELMPACEAVFANVRPGAGAAVVWGARTCVLSAFSDDESGADESDVPVDVGSAPRCVAEGPPYDAVEDLVGNAEELVAGCDLGDCRMFGNSARSGPAFPCAVEGIFTPTERLEAEVGFRCCSE